MDREMKFDILGNEIYISKSGFPEKKFPISDSQKKVLTKLFLDNQMQAIEFLMSYLYEGTPS
jgi:hypothetical protein